MNEEGFVKGILLDADVGEPLLIFVVLIGQSEFVENVGDSMGGIFFDLLEAVSVVLIVGVLGFQRLFISGTIENSAKSSFTHQRRRGLSIPTIKPRDCSLEVSQILLSAHVPVNSFRIDVSKGFCRTRHVRVPEFPAGIRMEWGKCYYVLIMCV
jgi:hypothetical protein